MRAIHRMVMAALTGMLLLGGIAHALSPADKCEASKLGTAGKYDFCRLKAEAKAVKIGGAPDFSKCDPKFSDKWAQAESTGGGMCPSNGDEAAVQAFITEHTDALEAALDGGTLPEGVLSCNADLATCNGNLATCDTSDTTCSTNLSTCTGNLGTCNTTLSTCNSNYASCSSNLATVTGGTATQADVLSGKTFSSSAGLGLTGTMPNNGAVNITPGTAAQAIPAGYHNGSGSVAGDADLVAGNILSGVNIFGVTGTLPPAQRLKTVQTQCDQGAGTLGACPGSPAGQDAALGKGLARSYTDNGDGTVTDNKTGLMWEKLSDDGSIHDKDTTYTWYTAFTTKVATLNSGNFAGHNDWRLPNVNELQSLADYGQASPAIDPAFNTGCAASCTVLTCSCTQSYFYWSATTQQAQPFTAWFVDFIDGAAQIRADFPVPILGDKSSDSLGVRGVRGGS